jgi:P-type Cu+ transporter
MNRSVSFSAVGHATSLFLAISFVLCVAGDLVMPTYQMHTIW